MTRSQQTKGGWSPRPLEWGPARHYGPQPDPLGTSSTTVDGEGSNDEKPDDN